MSDKNLIFTIESLARNAWPAREIHNLGGWQLRFNDGVTRRANSVWPNQLTSPTRFSLPEAIQHVEAFYQERGVPACYQISPAAQPAELDNQLVQLGYIQEGITNVQTTTIAKALNRCAYSPVYKFVLAHHVNAGWFNLKNKDHTTAEIADIKEDQASRLTIMQRIENQSIYIKASVAQTDVAHVMGVLENNWLAVFDLYTQPQWRGQGAASAVMFTLLRWAQGLGATETYLQVTADNNSANALYKRLGYETRYQYYYRTQPAS